MTNTTAYSMNRITLLENIALNARIAKERVRGAQNYYRRGEYNAAQILLKESIKAVYTYVDYCNEDLPNLADGANEGMEWINWVVEMFQIINPLNKNITFHLANGTYELVV
jgi:hypothetical protein